MQLNEIYPQIEEKGARLVTVTYDSVELLKQVEQERSIQFTMLHDEGVALVNAFGILNEDFEPGHRAYGVPHPGILILDADGVVRAKLAEPDYRERPDQALVLEALDEL